MNRHGQSIVEYALIAILVILGIVFMGPYVLRSVDAHFKLWDEGSQDSFQENIKQAPLNSIPYMSSDCSCTPTPKNCGGGTLLCHANEREIDSICTPYQGCNGEAGNPTCQPDTSCCACPVQSSCGLAALPATNLVTVPCPNQTTSGQTCSGFSTARCYSQLPITLTNTSPCYYGYRAYAYQCGSNTSDVCVLDNTCPMPICKGPTGPPNSTYFCATKSTTAPTYPADPNLTSSMSITYGQPCTADTAASDCTQPGSTCDPKTNTCTCPTSDATCQVYCNTGYCFDTLTGECDTGRASPLAVSYTIQRNAQCSASSPTSTVVTTSDAVGPSAGFNNYFFNFWAHGSGVDPQTVTSSPQVVTPGLPFVPVDPSSYSTSYTGAGSPKPPAGPTYRSGHPAYYLNMVSGRDNTENVCPPETIGGKTYNICDTGANIKINSPSLLLIEVYDWCSQNDGGYSGDSYYDWQILDSNYNVVFEWQGSIDAWMDVAFTPMCCGTRSPFQVTIGSDPGVTLEGGDNDGAFSNDPLTATKVCQDSGYAPVLPLPAGSTWYNSGQHHIHWWDGTQWHDGECNPEDTCCHNACSVRGQNTDGTLAFGGFQCQVMCSK